MESKPGETVNLIGPGVELNDDRGGRPPKEVDRISEEPPDKGESMEKQTTDIETDIPSGNLPPEDDAKGLELPTLSSYNYDPFHISMKLQRC